MRDRVLPNVEVYSASLVVSSPAPRELPEDLRQAWYVAQEALIQKQRESQTRPYDPADEDVDLADYLM